MTHNCRVCKVELTDDNWYPSYPKTRNYICKECSADKGRSWREANRDKIKEYDDLWRINNPEKAKAIQTRYDRNLGRLPMNENKKCPAYLGVYITEQLLRQYFNDVEMMPYGHPGYDIICNNGMKIDVKSSCVIKNRNDWTFHINRNTIADYFCCVAFDNRKDLNILHIWLIPGHVLNHQTSAGISPSTLGKWAEYEKPIDEAIIYCNEMKGE